MKHNPNAHTDDASTMIYSPESNQHTHTSSERTKATTIITTANENIMSRANIHAITITLNTHNGTSNCEYQPYQ
eukprot:5553136-Pyramimonas_sp.AAC.1